MWKFLKKNGITIIMGIGVVILLVNPDAKSWVLRQLMHTGLLNADIEKVADHDTDNAVNLHFVDESGTLLNTQSLRGNVVFINFWASWCPPCRAEMPSIQNLHKKFESHPKVTFLMVNTGEKLSKAQAFLEKESYSFPIYRVREKIPEKIYSGALPTTLVLDKKGRVRYHHQGVANYDSDGFYKQIKDLIQE